MKSNGRPLVPYMRQSRLKERTISIEEQRRDIQAWAQANDVSLAAEVIEQGVSGSKPWRERDLGEAVDACGRGEAAGIIVAWQDRLSRENGRATAEVWEALEQAGARLVAANEGLDTASGDQELTLHDQGRDRPRAVEAAQARTGRPPAAARSRPTSSPAGRRSDTEGARADRLTPDKRQAAKVLDAFKRRREGMPFLRSPVVRAGRTRRRGRSSPTRSISALLEHGPFRKEQAHTAIVSRDLFDAVQATRTTQPVPPATRPVTGSCTGSLAAPVAGRRLKVVRRHARRREQRHRLLLQERRHESPVLSRLRPRRRRSTPTSRRWFKEALRERSAHDRRGFRRPGSRGGPGRTANGSNASCAGTSKAATSARRGSLPARPRRPPEARQRRLRERVKHLIGPPDPDSGREDRSRSFGSASTPAERRAVLARLPRSRRGVNAALARLGRQRPHLWSDGEHRGGRSIASGRPRRRTFTNACSPRWSAAGGITNPSVAAQEPLSRRFWSSAERRTDSVFICARTRSRSSVAVIGFEIESRFTFTRPL